MSKNQRLLVELALMKMAHVNAVISLQEVAATHDGLKKKVV
jgi:hypothetical protein